MFVRETRRTSRCLEEGKNVVLVGLPKRFVFCQVFGSWKELIHVDQHDCSRSQFGSLARQLIKAFAHGQLLCHCARRGLSEVYALPLHCLSLSPKNEQRAKRPEAIYEAAAIAHHLLLVGSQRGFIFFVCRTLVRRHLPTVFIAADKCLTQSFKVCNECRRSRNWEKRAPWR